MSRQYHPSRHPDHSVRLAYQDGWAFARLGTPARRHDHITHQPTISARQLAFECGRTEGEKGGVPRGQHDPKFLIRDLNTDA